MTREQYYEDLKRRQAEHFKKIFENREDNWKPCAHEQCPQCHGTGIKVDGSPCIHYISCSCPKCRPMSHCVSIGDLELSVRSRIVARKLGVETLHQFCQYTREELLKYKGFGATSLREIEQVLASYDLKLKDSQPVTTTSEE